MFNCFWSHGPWRIFTFSTALTILKISPVQTRRKPGGINDYQAYDTDRQDPSGKRIWGSKWQCESKGRVDLEHIPRKADLGQLPELRAELRVAHAVRSLAGRGCRFVCLLSNFMLVAALPVSKAHTKGIVRALQKVASNDNHRRPL